MSEPTSRRKPRRTPPEVLQSSLMDCGPAALKCVLRGFGVHVDYEHIRRRCQTDVDGTSIDALADLANELGLKARRVLVARDHFLLPVAKHLPAIVVVRSDIGELHFVVVWRRVGPYVLVMDPAHGRRWMHSRRLLGQIPCFPIPMATTRFRKWAEGPNAHAIWHCRLARIGVNGKGAKDLLAQTAQDPSWRGFARFDAALRLVAKLVEAKALTRGSACLAAVKTFMQAEHFKHIPDSWHWITECAKDDHTLTSNGYVILQFEGPTAPVRRSEFDTNVGLRPTRGQTNELHPLSTLWQICTQSNPTLVPCIALAFVGSAVLVAMEALLLRGLLDLGKHLAFNYQQASWVVALLVLSLIGLGLDYGAGSTLARIGRHLSTKLRIDILERLPLVGDEYLRTRTTADLANRAHSVHLLSGVPVLWAQLLRSFASLSVLFAILLWLYPPGALPVVLMAAASFVTPWLGNRALTEGHLKLQTHAASLERFHLDALLGVIPIRVHQAAAAIQVEHEDLLTRWGKNSYATYNGQLMVQCVQATAVNSGAIWLVTNYLKHNPQGVGLLLLTFLALRVPSAAQELITAWSTLRQLRVTALRTLTLASAETQARVVSTQTEPSTPAQTRAVSVEFHNIDVVCAGRKVLDDVTLDVKSGEHVGIIGASGAGKSTLISLLLGWAAPQRGHIRVDGQPLTAERQQLLNRQSVWLDPAVQLWDQTLLDNLTFGSRQTRVPLFEALASASLLDVLPQLPDGLQSELGESGVRISGGQGQRVRLGRSLLEDNPGLVLMDEPFRGLEREKRQALLNGCRQRWHETTLLMVTHDVEDTLGFDKVVIIDQGCIVEAGDPSVLNTDANSRYARALAQARQVYTERWGAHVWKRLEWTTDD